MKCAALLIMIVFSFFLSCSPKRKEEHLMDQAEILLPVNPDSAYLVLNGIVVPDIMNNKLLARWCMLYAQAADQLVKDMPYIPQLLRTREWYKKHGTKEEQAWIGLYLGRSYYEDQLYLQASDAYSEALMKALEGNAYNAAGYICHYTAKLYKYTGQLSEERRKWEEAARYFHKAGNKKRYALALRDIARTWALEDSCLLGLTYMLKADSIARREGDVRGSCQIISGLGDLYQRMGETDKARGCYLKSLATDTTDVAPVYLALSEMYLNLGKFDSARLFAEKATVRTRHKYIPTDVLYVKYKLEKADNHPEKALYYFERFYTLMDSLYDSHKQADVIDAEKRYNQLVLLGENRELRRGRFIFASLLSVTVIICLTGWILYQEKNKRVIYKMQEQQCALEQKESMLRQLEAELKEKVQEGSVKEEALANYEEEINGIREEINRLRKEKVRSSAIAKKIKKLSSKVVAGNPNSLLTPSDWEAIDKLLDTIYIGLQVSLKSKSYNFTKAELEICYLSFFNLELNEEAILLNINPESVSKRRLRIRQKLGLENTSLVLSDYLISRL